MKGRKFIINYCIATLFCIFNMGLQKHVYAISNLHDLRFEYLTVENGLNSNRISSLFRERSGFLWIGSEKGINSFDGLTVKTYPSVYSRVYCIFESSKGDLWIGTTGGLKYLDRNAGSFQDLTNEENTFVKSIAEDQSGVLWASSYDGLIAINPSDKKVIKYLIPEQFNSDDKIERICFGAPGKLWMVTSGNNLIRFDCATKKFEAAFHIPFIKAGQLEENCLSIDNRGKVWIGTKTNGLISFDPHYKAFQQYNTIGDGKGTNGINVAGFFLEGNQYLYLALDHGGVNRLDLNTGIFEYLTYNEQKTNGLSNDGIWSVYKDFEGILYVGTSAGGVNIHNPKEERFKSYKHVHCENSLVYNSIWCFYEDSKGLIWIGTDGGGVSVFDPKNEIFTNYQHNDNDVNSLSGNAVLGICEDYNGDVWLGTWGAGLNKFERKTKTFKHFLPDESDPKAISSYNIYGMLKDENKNLWIVNYNEGIDVFDPRKGVVKKMRHDPDNPNSLPDNLVLKIAEHPANKIAFITSQYYSTYQKNEDIFINKSFDNNTILSDVIIDSKGDYWVATYPQGLLKVNKSGDIERFQVENGFLPTQISGLLEDNNGNIWVSSSIGLTMYDVKSGKFRQYNVFDGLQGNQFTPNAKFKASDGTLYFGGYNGFNTVKPESIKTNSFVPHAYINEFRIFNKPVDMFSPNTPLSKTITETNKIVLTHNQNDFSFGLASVNFTYPEKTRYAYQLSGYDKNWNYTDYDNRYVTYTNLGPGKYTFMVKASNNDHVWNETPTTVKITITPAIWQTWWFKILLVFIIMVMIWSFYFWRVNSLKEQQQVLEKTVLHRTTELRNTNEALGKSKDEIMIKNLAIEKQNLELEIANQTKNKLFSIIAHDLKNPFNTILGFVNVLLDDYDELNDAEKRNFLLIIQGSSQTAFALLENLLNWARTQTNKITLHFNEVNVLGMIEANVHLVKMFGENKDVRIVFDDIDPTHSIYVDRDMMDTVVRNLLTNAIKFSHIGDSIFISTIRRDDFIDISIKDQGVGMTSNQIEKLFMIGENHSTQGTLGETGTGLGIIICEEFVERNKGKISVKSILNEGTTFIIALPSMK